MKSITKCIPVFNAKTGVLSYTWDDLMKEKTSCPRCDRDMEYWYSRKRGVIISDHKYIFMAPRFKCVCGKTRTMRPYFIVPRKQYSVFSIQEILNTDISCDRRGNASYGSSMVSGLRKWAITLVKNIFTDLNDIQDERSVIRMLYEQNGFCWLTSILQKKSYSLPFDVYSYLSG